MVEFLLVQWETSNFIVDISSLRSTETDMGHGHSDTSFLKKLGHIHGEDTCVCIYIILIWVVWHLYLNFINSAIWTNKYHHTDLNN